MRESEFFLLLASPLAARSPWVRREIDYWLELHKGSTDRMLIVWTGGMLAWDDPRRRFRLVLDRRPRRQPERTVHHHALLSRRAMGAQRRQHGPVLSRSAFSRRCGDARRHAARQEQERDDWRGGRRAQAVPPRSQPGCDPAASCSPSAPVSLPTSPTPSATKPSTRWSARPPPGRRRSPSWGLAEERQREAERQKAIAEENEARSRRNLYAVHMNVVQQALRVGNLEGADDLLRSHIPQAATETDLRGFEWLLPLAPLSSRETIAAACPSRSGTSGSRRTAVRLRR